MTEIPLVNPPDIDKDGLCWNHQFTIPLLFDDCLSLLQKVCANWSTTNDIINSLNAFDGDFNAWAKKIEMSLEDLHTKYTSLKNVTDVHTSEIANIQSELVKIKNELAKIVIGVTHAKKYIFIGDSFNTTDTPPTAGCVPIVPWSTPLVELLKLESKDYYNCGISGAGFVSGKAENTNFLGQLKSINVENPEMITDIVVAGGINDINSTDDVYTQIRAFVDYASERFANATISLIFISWSKFNIDKLAKLIMLYSGYNYTSRLKIYGNGWLSYHNYDFFQPDGTHPNSAGSSAIARNIQQILLKDSYNNASWYYDIVVPSGNVLQFDFHILETQSESVIRRSTTGLEGRHDLNIPVNMTTESNIKIGTCPYHLSNPTYAPFVESGNYWGFQAADDSYINGNFELKIDPASLDLVLVLHSSGVSVTKNVSVIYFSTHGGFTFSAMEC